MNTLGGLAAMMLATLSPLAAQRVRSAKAPAGGVQPLADSVTNAKAPATAVIIPTTPNGVRLVAVPVPAELHGHAGHFEFLKQNTMSVVGRLEGDLTQGDSASVIALTVSVPKTAPAGRTTLGVMRFSCANQVCASVDVPVLLEVQARSALQVDPSRPLIGTHAGARVRTDVVVRNVGNATEQVTVAVQAPNDWRSRVLAPLPLRLAAGASATVALEITVSDDAGVGDYGVAVQATSSGGATGRAAINVRVGAGQRGAIGWRPVLVADAAVARDENGGLATAFGADLNGEVLPDVRANGRASLVHDPSLSTVTERSLGRLGYATNSSFLVLSAPTWEAGVGMLGVSNAGLSGSGLWGDGASFRETSPTWRGSVMGVAPEAGGHYLLGDIARRTGPAWTGLAASDLHDDVGAGRTARTIAATLELPMTDGALTVQAGHRGSDSVSGMAWLARFERRSRDWAFSAQADHSPGGSAMFSHAEDELQADGFRRVNNVLAVGGSAWHSRDGGISGTANFGSSGWSLTQQISLGRFGGVDVETHATTASGESGVGGFGNADREIRATWSGALSSVQTRLGVARGTLERNSSIADDIDVNASAAHLAAFGSASIATDLGTWELDLSADRTGAGVGIPTRQVSASARVDQVPLVQGRVYLRGEVFAYYLATTRSMAQSQVVGFDVRFGDSYQLAIDAERNDYQRSATGKLPWVVTTRIRRAIGLPPLRSAALHGLVYADLNGNGKRDRGERGVPGAIVHIDGDVVVTDASGRFAVGRTQPAQIDIDPLSLPIGWIAAPRMLESRMSGDIELPAIPTTPVDVSLRVGSVEGLDSTNIHLDRAIIVLTDSLGRHWTGTPSVRGLMRFDALPPGSYQVSADLMLSARRSFFPRSSRRFTSTAAARRNASTSSLGRARSA